MRFFPLFVVLFLCASTLCADEKHALPAPLRESLLLLNDGKLLEAQNVLENYEKENPSDTRGVFLLAHARWRMMWLSGYSPEEREQLVALLDRVDALCAPDLETNDDALFYSASTAGVRAQLAATENEWWDTAQLGKQMKSQAEGLLERDPEYFSAYYLLGSYNYFADALPGYIKFLRSLVFLPGGSRRKGLKQLVEAYQKGANVSEEAGRTLVLIYTYYEKRFDYGLQMCDNILSLYPDNYEIGLYKAVNLYYEGEWKESTEWLHRLRTGLRDYSQKHNRKMEVIPIYVRLDREAQFWLARSLMQQKEFDKAAALLEDLADPPLHEPYWLMRAVYLAQAFLHFRDGNDEKAETLIGKVLQWSDVKDSHDKAKELQNKKTEIGAYDIDFL